jgi:hypothetical protein
MLGQAPRVLLRHVGQQPAHHQPERHPRLRAVEQPPQPVGQYLQILVQPAMSSTVMISTMPDETNDQLNRFQDLRM